MAARATFTGAEGAEVFPVNQAWATQINQLTWGSSQVLRG